MLAKIFIAIILVCVTSCVTTSSVSDEVAAIRSETIAWAEQCVKQTPVDWDNTVKSQYASLLVKQGAPIKKSLADHNCRQKVAWASSGYPECAVTARNELEKLKSAGCPGADHPDVVAILQRRQAKEDKIKAKESQQKNADETSKAVREAEKKFATNLSSTKATHVIVMFFANGGDKACKEQIDGSQLCVNGVICEVSAYKTALEAGSNIMQVCESDEAAQQDFFLVTKEKMKFPQFNSRVSRWKFPVVRGRDSTVINGLGAQMPAAVWQQVAPAFDTLEESKKLGQ